MEQVEELIQEQVMEYKGQVEVKTQEQTQELVMEMVEMTYKEQGLVMKMEFRSSQIISLGPVFGRIPHVCYAHQER